KGVVVPHRGIVNQLLWRQHHYQLTPQDRILQKTPVGFDVAVPELLWPLLFGAQLVVAEPRAHLDPARLAALIRDHQITIVDFVVSALKLFLTEATEEGCASLRAVLCGGETLTRDVMDRCISSLRLPLHTTYG